MPSGNPVGGWAKGGPIVPSGPSGSVLTAGGRWRSPPPSPVGGLTGKVITHFVPYGSSTASCGEFDLPTVYTTDLRADVTCTICLHALLKATENRVVADIEKHLEKSLSVPASEGWQNQVAQGLIRSFEVGEEYVIDNLEKDLKEYVNEMSHLGMLAVNQVQLEKDLQKLIHKNRKKR